MRDKNKLGNTAKVHECISCHSIKSQMIGDDDCPLRGDDKWPRRKICTTRFL